MSYLEGVRTGEELVKEGVDAFNQERSWKERLLERREALSRQQAEETPLTPSQLADLQAGKIPQGLTRSQQLVIGRSEQEINAREKLAASKALADFNKGHTTLTQDDIDKTPAYKKAGLTPGTYPDRFINSQTRPATAKPNGLSDDKMNALIDKVGQNKVGLLPDDIFKGMGQTAARQAFMSKLYEKYPDWSPNAALAKRRELLGEASTKGTKGYVIATASKAVDANLATLEPLIKNTPSAKLQMATAALRKGERAVNDKDANKILGMLTTTAYEEARVENGGNAPSEDSQRDMRKILADGLDANGFAGAREALHQTNINRILSYDNPWETGQGDKKAGPAAKTVSAQSYKDPAKAEDIRNRYRSGAITKDQAKRELDAIGGAQ